MAEQADAVKGRDELSDKQDETDMSFPISVPERKEAVTRTGEEDKCYNMNNTRRGDCHVFVYGTSEGNETSERDGAGKDVKNCEIAFEVIGFKVYVHKDLSKDALEKELKKASKKDYSDCDALALVFSSHGGSEENKEFLKVYNETIETDELWKPFVGIECPSLAGKPKLFFIQACRGKREDKGVGMTVFTDSIKGKETSFKYVIPTHADILLMKATFEGLVAYRTKEQGSVFIQDLTETLQKEGRETSLTDMLLKVTRQVALESKDYKQVPSTTSTLMRKVYFGEMPTADSDKSS